MAYHNWIAADGSNVITAAGDNAVTPEVYAVAAAGGFVLDADVAGNTLSGDVGAYVLDAEVAGREAPTS